MRNVLLQVFLILPIRFIYERLLGWHYEGHVPTLPKFIGVFAHHTDHFDFLLMFYGAVMARRFPNWVGKKELFENPILGRIYLALGGIPVDRDNPLTALKQMVKTVKEREKLTFLINPEGTRQYSDHWKQGFYFLAKKTQTPLILIGLDYGQKRIILSEPFEVTGDVEADMQYIREFYSHVKGRRPERVSEMRLSNS